MKKSFVLIAAAAFLLSVTPKARAATTIEELQKQMDELKAQMMLLNKQPAPKTAEPVIHEEPKGEGVFKPI